MPVIFLNGRPVQADPGQTVLQVALAHGVHIPHFCWHPGLSVAGNCRICMAEVEGRGIDIACNMPVAEGLKVFTESPAVQEARRAMLQFDNRNHPTECGICDKSGECLLQDYTALYLDEPSPCREAKLHATKFYRVSDRILLDNERCVLCARCVRFTHEISGSHGLGIVNRGERALVRCVNDQPLIDPYSDNIIDLCPVGALLSRRFLYQARVWFLEGTRSVCPGCARGCNIRLWHRKPEWHLKSEPSQNRRIYRVTPWENPDVNRWWICNTARDLMDRFDRPRATESLVQGRAVPFADALGEARRRLTGARQPVALVSSGGSDEELAAFAAAFPDRTRLPVFVKEDVRPAPGEVVEDALLIRADKNPNRFRAQALFGDRPVPAAFEPGVDLLLVWGEGFEQARVPPGVAVIRLAAYQAPEHAAAAVCFPVSLQTERDGHYTNFQGVRSPFSACFPPLPGVAHAAELFAQLGGRS